MDSDDKPSRIPRGKTIFPSIIWERKGNLPEEWHKNLDGGLQPGDVELFVGEPWITCPRFNLGKYTSNFLKDNPSEKTKAQEFAQTVGIRRLSDMLQYYETKYFEEMEDELVKWKYIFTETPALHRLWERYIKHELVKESAERVVRIKQKLKRMPCLDSRYQISGDIIVDDSIRGAFHPKDCAILGVLGMHLGVVIWSSNNEI